MLLDVRMFIRDIQRPLAAIFGIRGQRRIQRNLHSLVPRVPHRIQSQIRSNPKQPGREFRARHIIRPRPIHANENLLRQILRLLPVPHHAIQEVDQRPAIPVQ